MFSKTLSSLITIPSPTLNHQRVDYFHNKFIPSYKPKKVNKILCLSKSNSEINGKEQVVIVGAGIAGLATSLALHRFAYLLINSTCSCAIWV